MPERKMLYRIIKDYDIESFKEYMIHVLLGKVLSHPVKEDAIKEYNKLDPEYKKIIETKVSSMH